MDDLKEILVLYTDYKVHKKIELSDQIKNRIHFHVQVDKEDTPDIAFEKLLDSFKWNDTKRKMYDYYVENYKLEMYNSIMLMLISD